MPKGKKMDKPFVNFAKERQLSIRMDKQYPQRGGALEKQAGKQGRKQGGKKK